MIIRRAYLKIVRFIESKYYRAKFKKFGQQSIIARNHRISGHGYIQIGDYCSFDTNLRLEPVSRYANEIFTPQLIIDNNVYINQNFHCTCAEKVHIGGGTSITANVGIFDIIHPYQNINENPRDLKIVTKPVEIGEDCLIGMNSVILPGTHLGKHCVVGANSTVQGVFSDYCVIVGSPAKVIKKYNFRTQKWIRI